MQLYDSDRIKLNSEPHAGFLRVGCSSPLTWRGRGSSGRRHSCRAPAPPPSRGGTGGG